MLNMARMYRTRPSSILHIEDEYTAYCMDEACTYIIRQLEAGETPVFEHKVSSMREFYDQYGGG